ncbi:hypothetical protein [Mycobacterium sp. E1747]|uniref:hypothetical protein n=1 Tax=Mycobacterium sp. E1747 TaxID=1834128 RepID=UPI000B29D060|nr:hypothetical protein [Mycobacterium sp. E1747]
MALRDYDSQASFADRARAAWRETDRSGQPRLHASVNFAFGGEDPASPIEMPGHI